MNIKPTVWQVSLTAVSVILSACGGGGSDSSSSAAVPSAPVVAVTTQTKEIDLNWAAVTGATSYKVFQNLTGQSGYTQLGSDISASTTNAKIPVSTHLLDWQNSRFLVQACNSTGCTSSIAINPANAMLDTIAYAKASNTAANSAFGYSTALSGDGKLMVVGAPYVKDDLEGTIVGARTQAGTGIDNHGAVYVYKLGVDGKWTQQAYLKASNIFDVDGFSEGGFGSEFGGSVAVSSDGKTIAVGASLEGSNSIGVNSDQTDYSLTDAGAVYLFNSGSDGKWTQKAYIKPSNTRDNLRFGSSLALSGTGAELAVGASGEDSAAKGINGQQSAGGLDDSGAVYYFTLNNSGNWTQQAYLKASNSQAGFRFGDSLALSTDGKTLAVGAKGENGGAIGVNGSQSLIGQDDNGAVYLFTRNGAGSWLQEAYIKASNTAQSTDTAGIGSEFGTKVALSGDGKTLAVGAPYQDSDDATEVLNDNSSNQGAVYVFRRNDANVWAQQKMLKTPLTGDFGLFGSSVALNYDGSLLVSGVTGDATPAVGVNGALTTSGGKVDSGSVFVFALTGTSWAQKSYVKASNTYGASQVLSASTRPQFGGSVALSADGTTLAVGAAGEYGSSTGVATGMDNRKVNVSAAGAGAVYLY